MQDEIEAKPEATPLSQNRRLIGAAALIAAGNIIQRILGLGRETVIATLFGASGSLAAYRLVAFVPQTLYQLIAGGEMVTSSLVPVFSEFVAKNERDSLWRAVSITLSTVAVVVTTAVLLLELFAPLVARLIGASNLQDPTLLPEAIGILRLILPVMLFLSISSVFTAVLQALERFTLPAFTIALYNASIIAVALIWPTSVRSLAWGMLLGSFLMILLQIPGLQDAKLSFDLNWRHPVVRRLLSLYAPIILGLVINQLGLFIGLNLATRTGDESVNYMAISTTLYQLPLGLVVVGLSTAILPTLSKQAFGPDDQFKTTLADGLRLVLTLILPAAFGLFALAFPIIQLLFEYGAFTTLNSSITASVLRVDLIGLPFAAVDQMLVYAFYARKDTLRPALVGIVSVVFYVVMASFLISPFGLLGLMAANAGKIILHAAIMIFLMNRYLGQMDGFGIRPVFIKSLGASIATGTVAYLSWQWLSGGNPSPYFLNRAINVLIPGVLGGGIYVVLAYIFNLQEIKAVFRLISSVKIWK
ncbi:MAG: murein biosynthesis integral membrane protein MurJ [Chloroflexota bacterium]